MNCNSKKNTLELLRNKQIIDNTHIINDLRKFQQLNNHYTDYVKNQYGIDTGNKLFDIKQIERKALFGNSYRRDNIITYYRAIPNNELFEKIDKATEQNLFEPSDFSNYLSEINSNHVLPKYEKYIIYKKNLLNRLENRLSKIKALKKKFVSNNQKLKKLSEIENQIILRIDGNEELELKGLKQEIAELENNPLIEKFGYYAEKDFERLDMLSKSDNPEDLAEARTIINFYEALGTFDVKEKHPLFEIDDIFDKNGNIILPDNVVTMFTKLRERAKSYENIIEKNEKNTITDIINSNDNVKSIFDENLDYSKIFSEEKGLKDSSYFDMFVMDITNGVFSHNGIVPQVMMQILQNTVEKNLVFAKKTEDKINELQPKVEKFLRELGYDIKIPGIKGVLYDLFRAVDKNGQLQDSTIQRYTPNFIDARNKMIIDFIKKLNDAKTIENPVKKTNTIADIYANRNNWYKKNTIVIDIGKIPEIINDKSLFTPFQTKVASKEAEDYSKKLKSILGKQGYKEEIEKQIKLIRNYQTMVDIFTDSIIAENGAADLSSLSDKGKFQIESWIKRNDPFLAAGSYYSSKPIMQGKLKLASTMTYNYSIPRKQEIRVLHSPKGLIFENTGKETGFYDKRFMTIENNPALKQFHDLLTEVQEKMFDSMPIEVRNKFSAHSLPVLQKNINEILFDKNGSISQKLYKTVKKESSKLKNMFGINPQDNLSYANVDPITGQPEYKVNSAFLKSNKEKINTRYIVELQRIKKALGLPATKRISKYDTFDITNNNQVISILAENLNIPSSLSAVQNRLKTEDLKSAEIGKILKNTITHQVVSENSFDLPKILKLYSYMTMEYAARQEVLPVLEMMKKHYERIKQPAINNIGKSITNAVTGETRLNKERTNAIKQINSWFERSVLGNYTSKNELGDTRIKRIVNIKFTNEQITKIFGSKLQTVIDGRIYNEEEKIIRKKIKQISKDLQDEYKRVEKEGDTDEMAEIGKIIKRLEDVDNTLGKHFSFTAVLDALFNFVRFKGLGWNLNSSITNFLQGQICNTINAVMGDYFTPKNIYRANHIVTSSFIKNISGGKLTSPEAKKLRNFMDKYRILQDASNELQKESTKSAFSSFRNLSPYEIVRRTEYLNQSPLLISMLLDQKIISKTGEQSNLWDAMNTDGTLKENFRTQENVENWEKANGKQYNNFKSKITKLIVNVHGDYDKLRGNMATEYITGKGVLMFKRWMARQFYQRFAKTQVDLESEIKDYKGRYYSHTLSSAFIQAGSLGFLSAGPVGGIAGGLFGLVYSKLWGINSGLNFLEELAFTGKEIFLNLLRIPINNLAGKTIIKESDYEKLSALSDRDIKNMKANLMEISIGLAFLGMILFTKLLFYHDKDDKDDPRRRIHNLIINKLMQLSGESTMYLNVDAAWNNTVGDMAVLRFFRDVTKTVYDAQQLLEGKDTILTGPNAGESAFYNQSRKTLFPGILKSGLGFKTYKQRQFKRTPFDTWFYSDEKKAQRRIQTIKAKTKKQYLTNDLSEEDIKKLTKEITKFYRKSRNETYSDVLQRIEKKQFKPKKVK